MGFDDGLSLASCRSHLEPCCCWVTLHSAWLALRVLSRPIPIAIEGGLQVDSVVMQPTVTIRTTTALPVTVMDTLPLMTQRPLVIRGAVVVTGNVRTQISNSGIITPVSIQPVEVDGAVT